MPKFPARVQAGERVAISIALDPGIEVHSCALEPAATKKALAAWGKGASPTSMSLDPLGTSATFRLEDSVHQIATVQNRSPEWRAPGKMRRVDRDGFLRALTVLHAAGGKDAEEALQVLHFTPGFVEATDQVRAARVDFGCVDVPVVVPQRMFDKFGSPRFIALALEGDLFYVLADEELRVSRVKRDTGFFDLDGMLSPAGSEVSLPRQWLASSSRECGKASPLGVVELRVTDGGIELHGVRDDGSSACSRSHPLPSGERPSQSFLLRGSYLTEAVEEMDADEVVLHYRSSTSALRFSVPGMAEVVWPLRRLMPQGNA